MDRIEGFRQYLGVAEEDRLNALNPPDKTPELFERFLPYAIALDVENCWAKRFAAVLAAAGAGAAVATWYAGNQWAQRSGRLQSTSSAARSRTPSRRPPGRPARTAVPAAAARPAVGAVAAVDRGGEGGWRIRRLINIFCAHHIIEFQRVPTGWQLVRPDIRQSSNLPLA